MPEVSITSVAPDLILGWWLGHTTPDRYKGESYSSETLKHRIMQTMRTAHQNREDMWVGEQTVRLLAQAGLAEVLNLISNTHIVSHSLL